MPMLAKILILEIISFIFFCVVTTIKRYERKFDESGEILANKDIKSVLLYLGVNIVLTLCLFIFSYSSQVFFSYSKFIVITGIIILSVLVIIAEIYEIPREERIRRVIGVFSFYTGIALIIASIIQSLSYIIV